jgi:hypothetical protein
MHNTPNKPNRRPRLALLAAAALGLLAAILIPVAVYAACNVNFVVYDSISITGPDTLCIGGSGEFTVTVTTRTFVEGGTNAWVSIKAKEDGDGAVEGLPLSLLIAVPAGGSGSTNFTLTGHTPTSSPTNGLTLVATLAGGEHLSEEGEDEDANSCVAEHEVVVVRLEAGIPRVIGVNDLVSNLKDPSGSSLGRLLWFPGPDGQVAAAWDEEDDLFLFEYLKVEPLELGDLIFRRGDAGSAEEAGEAVVLLIDSEEESVEEWPSLEPDVLADVLAGEESASSAKYLRIEGRGYSHEVDDAQIELEYAGCFFTVKTTVVQVELDRFAYTRVDAFPEIEILGVTGLVPGGNATVKYRVMQDVLEDVPGPDRSNSFPVPDAVGVYEYVVNGDNRLGNEAVAAIGYTVYDNEGTLAARWVDAGPSHKRVEAMPATAQMNISIKDARAGTPEEAPGSLESLPEFLGSIHATGEKPAYEIEEIKIFAREPSIAYTNEINPEVGNEMILQALLGENSTPATRASAAVVEISGSKFVGVNDRFPAPYDPGEDAAANANPHTDPDMIGLHVEGVKLFNDAIITWTVLAGDVRLVSLDGTQVGATVTGEVDLDSSEDSAYTSVLVEGRKASKEIDDVVVRFKIEYGTDDTEKPVAFRDQFMEAEHRLTVTDLRWTGWAEDGNPEKSGKRTDMLACDLDLRPAARIDLPEAEDELILGDPVLVKGTVRSMLDIVRHIKVNGQLVPQDKIHFMGQPVAGLTAASVAAMTDRLPPYEVTFEYELEELDTDRIQVEARNGIGPWPGIAKRKVQFDMPVPYAGSTGVVSAVELAKPAFGDLADAVSFFDANPAGQGWAFLYKTEVDHHGAARGVVNCYNQAGAQAPGLYRLSKPVVFLERYDSANHAIPGPGISLKIADDPAEAVYSNGATTGKRMLFPVELQVEDAGGIVPGAIEWLRGALLPDDGENGKLRILSPEHDDLPSDAELTLTYVAESGNPFPAFAESQVLSMDSLPIEFELAPTAGHGVAVFEITLKSELYGLLSKDRARVRRVTNFDLDIDNDTQIGSGDGAANYLPGYLGENAVLSTGTTFLDPQYQGQAMTLVLQGIGAESLVDEVIFEIVNTTTNKGFCGNATHESIEAEGTREDYSFRKLRDERTITITPASQPEDDNEYGGRLEHDRVWTRFWAKDYGGSCEVKITVISGGAELLSKSLRIPVDTQIEGIADLYLEMQKAQWEAVYDWEDAPSWPESLAANYDEEPRNPDNRTTCPVSGEHEPGDHNTPGDGLNLFEEYRGFILDYGPGHAEGGHKRLSVARRELPVMTAEMPGIRQSNAAGQNPNIGDGEYYENMRQVVTDFYRDDVKGAGIDLYWVNVPMDMGGPIYVNKLDAQGNEMFDENNNPVPYEGNRPHAYHWTGNVSVGGTNTAAGGAYVSNDLSLRHHAPEFYRDFYEPFHPEPHNHDETLANIMHGDPWLEKFVKVALLSRWGSIQKPSPVFRVPVHTSRNAIEIIQKSHHEREGAYIAVTGIAEEGGTQPAGHFTAEEFANILHYAVAHEIGHLILYNAAAEDEWLRRHPGAALSDGHLALMGTGPQGRTGITNLSIVNLSRHVIDLHKKASVPVTQPSNQE